MTPHWTIRRARPDDYEAVASLEVLLFSLHRASRPDYFKDASDCYPPSEYRALLTDPDPIACVAEADGALAGLCFGKVEVKPGNTVCKSRRIAVIEDLIVHPAYRGLGIAAALLARAKAQAVRSGALSLELCVWPFSEAALRLYEKLGMQVQYTRMELRLEQNSAGL